MKRALAEAWQFQLSQEDQVQTEFTETSIVDNDPGQDDFVVLAWWRGQWIQFNALEEEE